MPNDYLTTKILQNPVHEVTVQGCKSNFEVRLQTTRLWNITYYVHSNNSLINIFVCSLLVDGYR